MNHENYIKQMIKIKIFLIYNKNRKAMEKYFLNLLVIVIIMIIKQ